MFHVHLRKIRVVLWPKGVFCCVHAVWFVELARSSVCLLAVCLVAPRLTEPGMSTCQPVVLCVYFIHSVSVYFIYFEALFSTYDALLCLL